MILADSSAWIEYLRRTESAVDRRLTALLEGEGAVATTDPVMMEVLAGARDDLHLGRIRKLLRSCAYIATEAPQDYEAAADLNRTCRKQGTTVRSAIDCLIAAVAIRTGATVLHADRDFEAMARHLPLATD